MSFIRDTFFGGAERDAAEIQARSGREAIEANREALAQARGDLAPFRGAGEGILGLLGDFVREGPESDLERARGFEDIQRSKAAGGKLRSGGTLESLTGFNKILNARDRTRRFMELFNLATLGANAAGGQATATLGIAGSNANLITGIGNARAAGEIGAANTTRNTLFDLARIGFGGG